MQNPHYKELIHNNESKDINAVAERWNTISKNIKKGTNGMPILLPDILLVSDAGAGKTRLLRQISEYLYHQENLMEFYGTVKFFEFLMCYCAPNTEFTELSRFMDAVRDAAGFRNVYKGVVSIDMDEWVGHEEEKHFFTLLEYLSCNTDNWMIIFAVSPRRESHNMERILSMFFRIEKVTLELPATKELMGFITRKLAAYNLSLDKEAEEVIFRTVELLRGNKYFDGYKTLKLLCQDMTYHIFSSKRHAERVITGEVAALFSVDSGYIKRTLRTIEKKNTIGFRGD